MLAFLRRVWEWGKAKPLDENYVPPIYRLSLPKVDFTKRKRVF